MMWEWVSSQLRGNALPVDVSTFETGFATAEYPRPTDGRYSGGVVVGVGGRRKRRRGLSRRVLSRVPT